MPYIQDRIVHDADSHLMELDGCLDSYFERRLLPRFHELPYLKKKDGDLAWSNAARAKQADPPSAPAKTPTSCCARTMKASAASSVPTARRRST